MIQFKRIPVIFNGRAVHVEQTTEHGADMKIEMKDINGSLNSTSKEPTRFFLKNGVTVRQEIIEDGKVVEVAVNAEFHHQPTTA